MTSGEKIQAALDAKGWSHARAGRELGVTEKTVDRWCGDKNAPDSRSRRLLAETLGVTLDEAKPPATPATGDMAEVLARLESLEAGQGELAELLRQVLPLLPLAKSEPLLPAEQLTGEA